MKKLLSSLAVVTLIGVTSISVVTCGGETGDFPKNCVF